MFRRSFTWQRLRSVVAEHGRDFDYNLESLVNQCMASKVPVHVRYPLSSGRGKKSSASFNGAPTTSTPVGDGAPMPPTVGSRTTNPLQMLLVEPLPGKHVGVFVDGSAVCFDCSLDEVKAIRQQFQPCQVPAERALVAPRQVVNTKQYTLLSELEDLGYEAPAPHSYIDEGDLNAIVLENDDPKTKLPYMACFGELVQIEALTETLQPVASTVRSWQQVTKKSGMLSCSLKDVRMCRAQISLIQERQTSIDARQQIFWQEGFNQLRRDYDDAYETWEVQSRNDALKAQAGSIASSVAYFSEETHALTNHRLEWVIIVIIFLCLMNALATH